MRQRHLVAISFLCLGLSCSQEKEKSVPLVFDEENKPWYSYQMWNTPPEGTGWSLRTQPRCGRKPGASRPKPGLVAQASSLELGEYLITERIEPRHFFSKHKLASVWMFGKINPFSDLEGVSFRLTRGTIKFSARGQQDESSKELPRPEFLDVELSGYIFPDWFRNTECSFVSPKDGVITDAKCICINARGVKKNCEIVGDSSTIDLGRACCEQLNPDDLEEVHIEASFSATYCSDFCSGASPGLVHQWCPSEENGKTTVEDAS